MLDQYTAVGRDRAKTEQTVLATAINNLNRILTTSGFDTGSHLKTARTIHESLSRRYQAEFRGLVDSLPFTEEILLIYMFALSDISAEIAGTADGEECSNITVGQRLSETENPLVLKNRDITAKSLRPQTVVEYPSIGDYHGFLTVTTCGTPFVFQGVNSTGLVAANTFVDAENEAIDAKKRIKNGVIIRRVLEECRTVEEAIDLVQQQNIRRLQGFTLALADGDDSVVLEVDPLNETQRVLREEIAVRTNHFPDEPAVADESSNHRLTRLREITSEFPDQIGLKDLFEVSRDHENGPGPNSLCRHHSNGADEMTALGQSTTVSATVYQGGVPELAAILGSPCLSTPVTYSLSETDTDDARVSMDWKATTGSTS